jgi:hypothetical protein
MGQNKIYGLMGLIATVIGFLGKAYYRDYINSKGIDDFGIAGFLPSYFYVLGFSLLLLIRPTKHPILIISIVTIASVLFEFKQYHSSSNLDFSDIFASVGGGITAILISLLIERNKELK